MYAVKQNQLINAFALTLKQMKGETSVILTHSQMILESTPILKVLVGPEEGQQTGKFIFLSKHIFLFTCEVAFVWHWRNFTQTTRGFIYWSFCVVFLRCSPVLLQAISEVNRKQWMEAMDGKEPVGFTLSLFTPLRVRLSVWSCFWSFVVSVPDLSFSESKAGRE